MDFLTQVGLSNAVVATILGVTAALVGWISRRPALAHALWLLVLVKLITPPLYPVPVSWFVASSPAHMPVVEPDTQAEYVPAPLEAVIESEESQAPADEQGFTPEEHLEYHVADAAATPALVREANPLPSWKEAVPMLWIAGSFIWFTLATARLFRFQRLLRYAWRADHTLQEQVNALARRLGLAQCPSAWFIPGRVSPLLWALTGKASLILPFDLLDRLTSEQLEALLTHELAHLRRRDHWVRVLEFVTTGLFWWHPVVWWARHEIREAEEQCCDAWVVWALPETVRGYALALVETVDFLSEIRPALPPATTGIGYVRDLRRRMTMIMRGTTPRALTWSGGLVVLGVAAFMLPMLPTLAQDPQPGRSSPGDDLKRAEAELQRAAAALEQARAQADQARHRQKTADNDRERRPDGPDQLIKASEACLRCHADAHIMASSKMGDDVQDMHTSIVRLAADIQQQRAHLKEMEIKLKEATRGLEARTQTKRGDREKLPEGDDRPGRRPDVGREENPRNQEVPRDPAGRNHDKRAYELPRAEQPDHDPEMLKHLDLEKHNQDRINALTNQMERVLKELEMLRQEMRERSNVKPSKEVGKPGRGSKPNPDSPRPEEERNPESDARPNPGDSGSNPDRPNPTKR